MVGGSCLRDADPCLQSHPSCFCGAISVALAEPSQWFLASLCWLGPSQWPRYPSSIAIPIAKPTPAKRKTSISEPGKLHTSMRHVGGVGWRETQKLEPNNLCTRSEIQKDKESRTETGTADDYILCQAKLDRGSTTSVPMPSAICGWCTATLISSQAGTTGAMILSPLLKEPSSFFSIYYAVHRRSSY